MQCANVNCYLATQHCWATGLAGFALRVAPTAVLARNDSGWTCDATMDTPDFAGDVVIAHLPTTQHYRYIPRSRSTRMHAHGYDRTVYGLTRLRGPWPANAAQQPLSSAAALATHHVMQCSPAFQSSARTPTARRCPRHCRVGTALFGVSREHFRCTSDALTPVHPNFYRTKACALLRLP